MRTISHLALASLLLAGLFVPLAVELPAAEADAKPNEFINRPAGYVLGDNTQHVFYRDKDGAIIELSFKQGDPSWRMKDLTAEAKAPKSASNPSAYFMKKTQHVVYRGDDGQIHELYWAPDPGRWGHTNLSMETKAPKAVGNPSGFARDDNSTQHVVFRTSNDDICELFSETSGGTQRWNSKDLTAEAKAPKAAGCPCGYFLSGLKTQHVVYRDKEGQIHQLYFAQNPASWFHTDVSATVKAPKAAEDPSAFTRDDDKSQHIVFRTAGGDVYEMRHVVSETGKGWQGKDLTAEASAPKAEGRPCAFFLSDLKTEHVVYRDKEGQIHELYRGKDSGRGQHNNLSALTKAPKAAGDPTGYPMSKDNTTHVVYLTTDNSIQELFHVSKGDKEGWHAANLTAGLKGR